MIKIGNQQMLREINISTLLHAIFEHGPISRVELARKTKLSPTTVSVLIEDMIREKLVHETGTSGSGVGRKMTLLNIRADGGYVIGVDLSSSPARCVLLNLNGELIANQTFKPVIGEEQIRAELANTIRTFIRNQQIPYELIKRIGISLPGRLDDTQSVVMTSNYLKLDRFPLLKMLEDELSIPILLTNDLDAAGFAERFSGAAKGDHSIIFLMIDYGTGAGIVINGQIYHGSGGSAGRTPFFSPYCTPVLAERLRRENPEPFEGQTPEEVIRTFVALAFDGVQPYHDLAELMIHEISDYCGKALLLVNPQKMILGGWITDNKLFFDRLVTAIHQAESSPYGDTPVLPFHWKMYGAAMGAATLGLYEIFKQKTVQ
ncbi:ROK family transcriptional regulator [Paenibacillus radicis (ex Gao et al. 2016)]|uniref:N-acetylglucosamine repressor n=1 Tax=Paenibacillus radicis (ex Gao et al. 2016) TaxID=1737354 RepID=A0A917LZ27_9BACL|nr:ROK family transcriptional regulator [Paenibacillus radicis (ex Gao et al. 2016)]GGG65134.1 N-acetylglucosamine repressor [Paenibacillus radicis (ex Gao et al. 2016)]